MRLHSSLIERLVKIFTTYGGHREEHRLVEELKKMDLSIYEQQSTGASVLVDTSELKRQTRP